MRTIASYYDNDGQCAAIVSGPDYSGVRLRVNGKFWRFDFDKRLGPTWLTAAGEPRLNQNPPRAVWRAFDRWMKREGVK